MIEAYKIENNIKLTEFESKLSECQNSVLKGLFSVIEWDQVPNMVVYGLSEKKTPEYYKHNILRVPQKLLASSNLPDLVQPMLKASKETKLPFNTSIYSTSKLVSEKLKGKQPNVGE